MPRANPQIDWSKLTLRDQYRSIAEPCIQLVSYSFQLPRDGKGFAHLLKTFGARFGRELKFYRDGKMKRFAALKPTHLDLPLRWFGDMPLLAKKMLSFSAHSGDNFLSMRPPYVDLKLWGFESPPTFVFQLCLPTKIADTPDELVAFAREAFAELPLDHGYCGYAFVWDKTASLATAELQPGTRGAPKVTWRWVPDAQLFTWMASQLKSHAGLDYGDTSALATAANEGLVAVDWLTFLGPRLVERLGGAGKVKAAGVKVSPFGQGALMLRAGAAPQLGGRTSIPEYRAVGKLLKSLRAPQGTMDEYVTILGLQPADEKRWLRRSF